MLPLFLCHRHQNGAFHGVISFLLPKRTNIIWESIHWVRCRRTTARPDNSGPLSLAAGRIQRGFRENSHSKYSKIVSLTVFLATTQQREGSGQGRGLGYLEGRRSNHIYIRDYSDYFTSSMPHERQLCSPCLV